MASSPEERQHYEDQVTVNLYARRLLSGNARVIVVDGGSDGISGLLLSDLRPGGLESLRETCAREGYRLIEGSALFTTSDRPRPYKSKLGV